MKLNLQPIFLEVETCQHSPSLKEKKNTFGDFSELTFYVDLKIVQTCYKEPVFCFCFVISNQKPCHSFGSFIIFKKVKLYSCISLTGNLTPRLYFLVATTTLNFTFNFHLFTLNAAHKTSYLRSWSFTNFLSWSFSQPI